MTRRPPLTCKRHACADPRESGHLVCACCWREVPRPARDRYLRARRLRLTKIAGEIGRDILRALGRKPATPAPVSATQAYQRTAAMLGEHEELLAAE